MIRSIVIATVSVAVLGVVAIAAPSRSGASGTDTAQPATHTNETPQQHSYLIVCSGTARYPENPHSVLRVSLENQGSNVIPIHASVSLMLDASGPTIYVLPQAIYPGQTVQTDLNTQYIRCGGQVVSGAH